MTIVTLFDILHQHLFYVQLDFLNSKHTMEFSGFIPKKLLKNTLKIFLNH